MVCGGGGGGSSLSRHPAPSRHRERFVNYVHGVILNAVHTGSFYDGGGRWSHTNVMLKITLGKI